MVVVNVGALVGSATGTTTLSNIELIGDESQSSSDAEIKGTGSDVGGLVGQFYRKCHRWLYHRCLLAV